VDGGERRSEVVRDGLEERVLQLIGALQVRDVEVHALPELRSAALVSVERSLLPHPHRPAVAGDHPILDAERAAVFERAAGPRFRGLDVVWMRHDVPQIRVREPFMGGVSE
jgi:hypothetical protein